MNKFETFPIPQKPEEIKSVKEAEEIIRAKQESINQSPRPTEGAELELESPEETGWKEKISEMNKRAEEIAIHLEQQRLEDEKREETRQAPKEAKEAGAIEEADPKTEKEVLFLKNFIESYIKQYAKDLNDIKWLETIDEERKNKLVSFLSGELQNLLFNKDYRESAKVIKLLEKSLSPVGKEIFKKIKETRFAPGEINE